jgi:hypothetical protein
MFCGLFVFVFQLLPLCTATEWKMLAKGIHGMYGNKMEDTAPQILVFADSVLLLLTVLQMEGTQDSASALTCLDYCIRNLGLILKVCTEWHAKGLHLALVTSRGQTASVV